MAYWLKRGIFADRLSLCDAGSGHEGLIASIAGAGACVIEPGILVRQSLSQEGWWRWSGQR
jgi:hypothetical protein